MNFRWCMVLLIVACGKDGGEDLDSIDGVDAEVNSVPSQPGIVLTPAEPTTVDDLVIDIVTPSVDADGDEVEYEVTWALDGEVLEELESHTLQSMFTERGQTWTVTVTPTDGVSSGTASTDEVEIRNSPPDVESLIMEPAEIYEKSEVTCTLGEVTDADSDPVGMQEVWVVNGVEVDVTGPLTGTHFDKGDEVICRAYVDDGVDTTDPIDTDPVTVLNTPPVVNGCLLDNTNPTSSDVVGVISSGFWDDDDDPEGYLYLWYIDFVPTVTTPTVDSSMFERGSNIYVELTAWDGEEEGNTVVSDSGTGVR